MKSDFLVALTQLAAERGLPREIVLSAVEDALISAYKKDGVAAGHDITVKLDPASGGVTVNILKTVVQEVQDGMTEVALQDARKLVPTAQIGEVITTKSMSHNAGRIAAQTAKQVVMQRLRDAEREMVYAQFEGREGEILYVTLTRVEGRNIIVDLGGSATGGSTALMPFREQVPTETYRPNEKLRVLLKTVERTESGAPELIVSRSDELLLRRLFEAEVPEIYSGAVEIEAIAREAGSRSKVAVRARQDGVDPVGSCVGLRGIRIQNIVNELRNEKIDVVEWHREARVFIAKALSPAQVLNVELNVDDDSAMAVVPEKHLSLAIGREGQNVRLAARLTGWRLDIKSNVEYEAELADRARRAAEERALAKALAIEAALANPAPAPEEEPVADDTDAPELAPAAEIAPEPAAEVALVDETPATAQPEAIDAEPAVDTLAEQATETEPVPSQDEQDALDELDEKPASELVPDAEVELVAESTEPEPDEAPVDEASESEPAPTPIADTLDLPEPSEEAVVEDVVDIPIVEQAASEPVPAAPEPLATPAAADISPPREAPEPPSTPLRDLPDDIWSIRRARARRAASEDGKPGRIRFAEDIVGLRGGVTASRRGRRRNDAPANNRSAPPRRRRSGRRRR